MDYEKESNHIVSVSVGTEEYKLRIQDLAVAAMEELTKVATGKEPLWQPGMGSKVLYCVEYMKQFGQVDRTLQTIVANIGIEQTLQPLNLNYHTQIPALPNVEIHSQPLQTEASRETWFLVADPVHIVELLMNNVGLLPSITVKKFHHLFILRLMKSYLISLFYV